MLLIAERHYRALWSAARIDIWLIMSADKTDMMCSKEAAKEVVPEDLGVDFPLVGTGSLDRLVGSEGLAGTDGGSLGVGVRLGVEVSISSSWLI